MFSLNKQYQGHYSTDSILLSLHRPALLKYLSCNFGLSYLLFSYVILRDTELN